MQPNYTYHLFFCTNDRSACDPKGSCAQKNANQLRNYMKSRVKENDILNVRVNQAGCLDQCEKGPVLVIYPENVWYRVSCEKDVDDIIASHLKNGQKLERLML